MGDVKVTELSKTISSTLNQSEERSGRLIDAFVGAVKNAVASGKDVVLSGFGTFTLAGPDGKPMPGMYRANLAGDLSSRMGEGSPQKIEEMIGSLLDALKAEVLGGKRIVLDDIGVFEVKHERPQIERQALGHRLIRPAMSVLSFTPTKPVQTSAGECRLVFNAADDLRKRVEQFKTSAILMIAQENDWFWKTLEYYFKRSGWETETVTDLAAALKRIESGKPYLALVDAGLGDYQKFCQALKSRRDTTNTPMIVLYPSEASYNIIKDVTVIGDENLWQPFEFREVMDRADTEIMRAAEEELIFLQQMGIHIPTDEQCIEKVIDFVHKLLEHSGVNEEGQVAMSAAFREAVVNAAQHGNKYKKDKKIEVQYLLDAEKITLVVRDQGGGFNHELYVKSGSSRDAISAARERHMQGRMGGLGIMLMLRCCERLEYNQAGNQITLTKYLKPQE